MKRQLLLYPDSRLREKAHQVRLFDDGIISLGEDMRRIMRENNGMGLAANQVGDMRRIIIVEYPISSETGESAIPFTILVNPTITN
jgi:peptide deformylase